MTKKANNLIICNNFYDAIKSLSDENAGKLFKAIFDYHLTGEVISNNEIVDFAFLAFKNLIDENKEKYNEKCRKNGENIKKYWENKRTNTNEYERIRTNTNIKEKNKIKNNIKEKNKIKNNINENNIILLDEKQKKQDPFIANSIVDLFVNEYKKVFNNKPYLTSIQKQKIMELNADVDEFKETIPLAIEKLKDIKFKGIPDFKPTVNWLLKENNYTGVLNGAFDLAIEETKKKEKTKSVIQELQERELKELAERKKL